MRHGDTAIWGGQTNNAVSFPPGPTVETLEVGVFAAGGAAYRAALDGGSETGGGQK